MLIVHEVVRHWIAGMGIGKCDVVTYTKVWMDGGGEMELMG
jgi:hypothetical protein